MLDSLTGSQLRYLCIIGFWIEFGFAAILQGRQFSYISHAHFPKNLRDNANYDEKTFRASKAKMQDELWMNIKIKLFNGAIWTVVICSDFIPFLWDSFQLADSEYDFLPNFIPLEVRQDISFSFFFSLLELCLLDLPGKYFNMERMRAYSANMPGPSYWFRSHFEKSLRRSITQSVGHFLLSITIGYLDENLTEVHSFLRHTVMIAGYIGFHVVADYFNATRLMSNTTRERYPVPVSGPLRDRLEPLCRSENYDIRKVYVWRIQKGMLDEMNAWCVSYFGVYTEVVFVSTLIKDYYKEEEDDDEETPGLTIAECEGIFAHEIGHYKMSHNERRHLLVWVMHGIFFGLVMHLREKKVVYEAFNFEAKDFQAPPFPLIPGYIVLSYGILNCIRTLMDVILNFEVCRQEVEADEYSVKMRRGEEMKRGISRLKALITGYPSSDPWYRLFYDHHPPLDERVQVIDEEIKKRGGGGGGDE